MATGPRAGRPLHLLHAVLACLALVAVGTFVPTGSAHAGAATATAAAAAEALKAEESAGYAEQRAEDAIQAAARGDHAATTEHAAKARHFLTQVKKRSETVHQLTGHGSPAARQARQAEQRASDAVARADAALRTTISSPPDDNGSGGSGGPREPVTAPNLKWLDQYRSPACTSGPYLKPPVWRAPGPSRDPEDLPTCAWVNRERQRLFEEQAQQLESKVQAVEAATYRAYPCTIDGISYPDCRPSPCEVTDIEHLDGALEALKKYADAKQMLKLAKLAGRASMVLTVRDIYCSWPQSPGNQRTPSVWLAPGPKIGYDAARSPIATGL
jgi:hypothetical protein